MSDNNLLVFLSYSSKDKELAGEIKRFLENFGIDVFLAHEKIAVSKEWEKEIYKNLKNCDVVIPIITKNFKESDWTDQECGIAYSEDKYFIPISVDGEINPYGFLEKYQAYGLDSTKKDKGKKLSEKKEMIEPLIDKFNKKIRKGIFSTLKRPKINTYEKASFKFKIIRDIEPFDNSEVNKLVDAAIENTQIHENYELKQYLKKIVEKYEDKIGLLKKKKLLFKLNPNYEDALKIVLLETDIGIEDLKEKINEKEKNEDLNKLIAIQLVAEELGVDSLWHKK